MVEHDLDCVDVFVKPYDREMIDSSSIQLSFLTWRLGEFVVIGWEAYKRLCQMWDQGQLQDQEHLEIDSYIAPYEYPLQEEYPLIEPGWETT